MSSSCIHLVPIFNHLDDQTMDIIQKKVISKSFKKNEYIYMANDKTDVLFIVRKGSVRIYRIVDSGKEQLVRILGAGDFAGELTIFNDDNIQEEYAEAMVDTDVCMIYKDDFKDLLIKYPQISLKLLDVMSKRLSDSEKQTTTLSTEQVDKRLALYLADLINTQDEENIIITLPISRKDIASFLGTTPETISRKFKELEEKGLIEQLSTRKIKIKNVDDLMFYI